MRVDKGQVVAIAAWIECEADLEPPTLELRLHECLALACYQGAVPEADELNRVVGALAALRRMLVKRGDVAQLALLDVELSILQGALTVPGTLAEWADLADMAGAPVNVLRIWQQVLREVEP